MAPETVTLDAAAYWQLRALMSEASRLASVAAQAMNRAKDAQEALRVYQQALAETSPALVAGDGQYHFDDAALTVTVPENG